MTGRQGCLPGGVMLLSVVKLRDPVRGQTR